MEPTLSQIEDYNGNESTAKKHTVNIVIGVLLLVGVVYTGVKMNLDSNMPNEFIPYTYSTSK
ncbi:MAG: hypothetical protein IE909_12150 [Campylobacterales bacterium]|nr:hypothetical protein [Campylobacterales bacterium]